MLAHAIPYSDNDSAQYTTSERLEPLAELSFNLWIVFIPVQRRQKIHPIQDLERPVLVAASSDAHTALRSLAAKQYWYYMSYLNPTTRLARMKSVMLTPSTAGPRSALEWLVVLCQFVPGKLAPQSRRLTIDDVGEAGVAEDKSVVAPVAEDELWDGITEPLDVGRLEGCADAEAIIWGQKVCANCWISSRFEYQRAVYVIEA